MNVNACLVALLLAANVAHAQGFADLGRDADGFAMPRPGAGFEFPRDHGPHPDFRIEWWYLTATLTDADGRDYGLQWTLFRSALRPGGDDGWDTPQIWMGHAGLTTAESHFVAERLARGGIGQAGVTVDPFAAWIDDWRMASRAPDGADALSALTLGARGRDFAYDLMLQATGPIVAHGEDGYSVKSASGQASHYYSQPFYDVTGTLDLADGPVDVIGLAWLDREWSSQPLDADQSGWDWFSLHFEDGAKLMGFGLRSDDGVFTSATWIDPDGTPTPYADGALRLTPVTTAEIAGRMLPVEWRLELPDQDLDIRTRPLNQDSWMSTLFPYWEGPIRFSGSHEGTGYLEMTGY